MKETYIQYGVPSNWADNYELIGISASTFKSTPKKNLITKYKIPEEQIDFVKNCLVRQPIESGIMQKLLENSAFTCCSCQGIKSDAYIIHHIIEYSISKDNAYTNLAVLCPNDHDLAHREGISLTSKITEKQIRAAKTNWEKKVKDRKKKAASSPKKKNTSNWRDYNPFKELQSYAESDKDFFFGRKQEIDELERTIYKYNIVGLFGESGTGKTSLVNAGLIPELKDNAVIVISVRCLDEPIKRVREALIKALKENKIPDSSIEEIAMTDSFPHLIIQLNSLAAKKNIELCIIIDQFEELFTRAKEDEREQLAKGISEALSNIPVKGEVYFLLSLREDYIGDLWDWAHKYNLENAWVRQYRIKRLSDEKANEVIIEPLELMGIKVDTKFIHHLISELKDIGAGAIYPPYLQIICSALFEEYKVQNLDPKPILIFGHDLYKKTNTAASIIAEYLSESMLEGLTSEEKIHAQNILDVLTGPEGLRTFLNLDEIARYIGTELLKAKHVTEHLIKKKIVLPVTENDSVKGYELVHDFLSKKFFEKLSPDAKKARTTIEIFRIAFKDWKQHGVLASQDRLEILAKNSTQLELIDEEWFFIIKSCFSVYWWYNENEWIKLINKETLARICITLLNDTQERIVENSIRTLAKIKGNENTSIFKDIINSTQRPIQIRTTAISVFHFDVTDIEILETLKTIIKGDKDSKVRKEAIYAFGANLSRLAKSNTDIIDKEIGIIHDSLSDSKTEVRKQAASVLGYTLINKKSVSPLLKRLDIEYSITSRKAIISALGALLREGESTNIIATRMHKIILDKDEDYRVINEAKMVIDLGYDKSLS